MDLEFDSTDVDSAIPEGEEETLDLLGPSTATAKATSPTTTTPEATGAPVLEERFRRLKRKPIVVPGCFARSLQVVRAPVADDPEVARHERDRKIQKKPPATQRRVAHRTSKEPKKPSPTQRINEFPGQSFRVSGGKLFCGACKESLSRELVRA